jgi:hypothetical protein
MKAPCTSHLALAVLVLMLPLADCVVCCPAAAVVLAAAVLIRSLVPLPAPQVAQDEHLTAAPADSKVKA